MMSCTNSFIYSNDSKKKMFDLFGMWKRLKTVKIATKTGQVLIYFGGDSFPINVA